VRDRKEKGYGAAVLSKATAVVSGKLMTLVPPPLTGVKRLETGVGVTVKGNPLLMPPAVVTVTM
jgi:hypothetical protein